MVCDSPETRGSGCSLCGWARCRTAEAANIFLFRFEISGFRPGGKTRLQHVNKMTSDGGEAGWIAREAGRSALVRVVAAFVVGSLLPVVLPRPKKQHSAGYFLSVRFVSLGRRTRS